MNEAKKTVWQYLLTAITMVFLADAMAGESLAYFCEIKSVAVVAKDGVIREIKKNQDQLLTQYLGSKFKVVKETGEIDGPIVTNKSAFTRSTTIIDEGGPFQSYKVLSTFGPEVSILYIQIDDYLGAITSGKGRYTFSGFRWQEFISGICS